MFFGKMFFVLSPPPLGLYPPHPPPSTMKPELLVRLLAASPPPSLSFLKLKAMTPVCSRGQLLTLLANTTTAPGQWPDIASWGVEEETGMTCRWCRGGDVLAFVVRWNVGSIPSRGLDGLAALTPKLVVCEALCEPVYLPLHTMQVHQSCMFCWCSCNHYSCNLLLKLIPYYGTN